jgi:hypothetical protein
MGGLPSLRLDVEILEDFPDREIAAAPADGRKVVEHFPRSDYAAVVKIEQWTARNQTVLHEGPHPIVGISQPNPRRRSIDRSFTQLLAVREIFAQPRRVAPRR